MNESTDFIVDAITVRPALNLISSHARETRIEPRLMALIVRLAQADGDVVSRDDLLDAVWGQQFASDEVLTQAISKLRRIFAEHSANKKLIETVPKRGYRLTSARQSTEPGEADNTAAMPPNLTQFRLMWLAISLLMALVIYTQFFAPKTELREIYIELDND